MTPVGVVPVWALAAAVWTKRDGFGPKNPGYIELVTAGKWTSALADWKAAQRVLKRVAELLAKDDHTPDIVNVALQMLKPGGVDAITTGQKLMQFHLPLVTNPRAWLYCEGIAASPSAGVLNFVPTPHVAVNFGSESRVHLIAEIQPEALAVPDEPESSPAT